MNEDMMRKEEFPNSVRDELAFARYTLIEQNFYENYPNLEQNKKKSISDLEKSIKVFKNHQQYMYQI